MSSYRSIQVSKNKGSARVTCSTCGSATRADEVSLSMWSGIGLVVIENIPARICDYCEEQFYDEKTQARILELSGNGFPDRQKVREITVPVYSLLEIQDASAEPSPPEPEKRSGT